MKTTILIALLVLINWVEGYSQITSPIIKARFGVDGDLRANFFNGAVQTSNDDWFNLNAADTSGKAVIDTTGAAAILAGYRTDVSPWLKRSASFYRTMSRPQFSVINNRLWLDAIFVRDYHGTDTTVYTSGSDKNGMSPGLWTGGVQGVPDKNDILDMFVHVRRAGPNTTDSLWMFGGLSLDNTTGNRYFDFEMYQTDIYYDRTSKKFYGYGTDAGHTSWQFDAAGKITRPGDIIFSGEFQSGTLTKIEARIWVKKTDWQTIVPASFNYSGLFDGDGSGAVYGYASISPNTLGAFYTGLGSPINSWAGPFGLVLQDNSLAYSNPGPASATNSKYTADQFIEFSVNLTKLGLDPVTLLGGDVCGTPFNRIVVKTRASASFTAELKDFVAPTDLFLAPRAIALTETPFICNDGSGLAEIYVTNPISTSFYQWSTADGSIVSNPATGPSIIVDRAGTYIVKQYLQVGCSIYASDTILVQPFSTCMVLENNLTNFKATLVGNTTRLDWQALNNLKVQYFEVERSFDGINFESIGRINKKNPLATTADYSFNDNIITIENRVIYYRIKLVGSNGMKYSNIASVTIEPGQQNRIIIFPNPVKDIMQVQVSSIKNNKVRVDIFEQSGKLVISSAATVKKGNNIITINGLDQQPAGVYFTNIYLGEELFRQKILVTNQKSK
ncbi:MAG TPA: T9SS type A sorting domain-containing protein [Chitinophagaceae bacterium]|nr:T9SS type A sorting domain-containing protein [Chitinophagaceae bacterium]